MDFHIGFIWLLALVILPVLLYLVRPKAQVVRVSALFFFKTLAKEHQESSWLRRVKKVVSFVLTMLILVASVLILARFTLPDTAAKNYQTVVVLIDRSASMAATDQYGQTRLAVAKEHIHQYLDTLPESIGKVLIAYDKQPEVIQPRTLAGREFISGLDQVVIQPIPSDFDLAIETATLLAGLEKPALLLHVSDRTEHNVDMPDGIDLIEKNIANTNPINVGITSFQLRPTPLELGSYDVHARVELNTECRNEKDVNLELFIDDIPTQIRQFSLLPGEGQTFEFQVQGIVGGVLRTEISTEGDQFALDNWVMAPLPESKPMVVVWIRAQPDAYTNLALQAIQESATMELLVGTPEQWPLKNPVDAVIFDGWLPKKWPIETPAIVINPPGSSGPIIAKGLESPIPYNSVRATNPDHPVLYRVNSGRLAVSQTSLVETAGAFSSLWKAGNEPLLVAGEVEGQRIVVMAFSPQLSEQLPLTASFPILLGNSILWVVSSDGVSDEHFVNSASGDFINLKAKKITWIDQYQGRLRERSFPIENSTVELSRLGIWKTDSNQTGASNLLSSKESNISGAIGSKEETNGAKARFNMRTALLLLVVILLGESWLFHRLAVY